MRLVPILLLWSTLPTADASVVGEPPQASENKLRGILDCRNELDGTKRLACFDKSAASLAASMKQRDIIVLDRAETQAARRSLFGFTLPRLPMLATTSGQEGDRQIEDTVRSATVDRDGNWIVTLATGAVWAQTDGQVVAHAPRQGDKVVIRQGTLGSYFMKIGKQPGVKARRQG